MTKCLLAVLMLPTLLVQFAQPQPPAAVSIVQLISQPEKYDGKTVVVFGFLGLEREHPAIYFHREDLVNALITNALWVDVSEDMGQHKADINLKYVRIVGVFRAEEKGQYKVFGMGGGLTGITNCKVWSDPAHTITEQRK
jgi:hypothetical protein